MNERTIIALISAAVFILVAFTSIVPLLLHSYGINNMFVIKGIIGLLTLACGYGIIWGLFKKENKFQIKKGGKIRIRTFILLIGLVIICLAWFTDLPLWLADMTGLSNTFLYDGQTLNGGIGMRIFTSILTAIGILFVRFSIKREEGPGQQGGEAEARYQQLLEKGESAKWY